MNHGEKFIPIIHENILIITGGAIITACTLYGIMNDPGRLIKQDLLLGPVIAAGRILVPIFITIGLVSLVSRFKKCAACGKILFWRGQMDCT